MRSTRFENDYLILLLNQNMNHVFIWSDKGVSLEEWSVIVKKCFKDVVTFGVNILEFSVGLQVGIIVGTIPEININSML